MNSAKIGRPARPRLSKHVASALRDYWEHVFLSKRGTGFSSRVIEAAGRSERSVLPLRSSKWLDRARDRKLELARDTAVEIILRFRRCGVRTPENLCEMLVPMEPAALVFPNESRMLSDRIAFVVEQSSGYSLPERTRKALRRYLRGFENLAKLKEGEDFVHRVQSVYGRGGVWRSILTRIMAGAVELRGRSKDGFKTRSAIQILGREFADAAHARADSGRTKV
jgi:hypothetical protein